MANWEKIVLIGGGLAVLGFVLVKSNFFGLIGEGIGAGISGVGTGIGGGVSDLSYGLGGGLFGIGQGTGYALAGLSPSGIIGALQGNVTPYSPSIYNPSSNFPTQSYNPSSGIGKAFPSIPMVAYTANASQIIAQGGSVKGVSPIANIRIPNVQVTNTGLPFGSYRLPGGGAVTIPLRRN